MGGDRTTAGGTRGHRRRRLLVAGVALGVAVVGAIVFVVLWQRAGSRPVPVEEVLERFHPVPGEEPDATLLRPRQGVYRYRGSGTERISTPPRSQSQGPEIPATVEHRDDGCWTFRIDYSSNHWQTWDYCPRDGGLVELGGQTFQRWDFVVTTYDVRSTSTCDPPAVAVREAMTPGDEWEQSCSATTEGSEGVGVSAGPYRFVGEEVVDVDGEGVPAHRFRQERVMSGSQSGTQTADLWFAVGDGLPLRNERRIEVRSDTILGTVTYEEEGGFRLAELGPVASTTVPPAPPG